MRRRFFHYISMLLLFFMLCHQALNAQDKKMYFIDTSRFEDNLRWNRERDLTDLTRSKDSIIIRLGIWTLANLNPTFEIILNPGHAVLRKYYHCQKPICLEPDTGIDAFINELQSLDLLNIPDETELERLHGLKDTLWLGIDDGITYSIEISTPAEYRFIRWSNPQYLPKPSRYSKAVIKLSSMLYSLKKCECDKAPGQKPRKVRIQKRK